MKNRGFTLIELLIVVCVLGILVAIFAPTIAVWSAEQQQIERKLTCVDRDGVVDFMGKGAWVYRDEKQGWVIEDTDRNRIVYKQLPGTACSVTETKKAQEVER